MSTRCTVIAYFYAKPEKRRELQAILEDFVAQTRKESGCINYHLHQSDKNPDVFVFYENWATRKDLGSSQPTAILERLSRQKDGLFDPRYRGRVLQDAERRRFTAMSDGRTREL